jgi:hypothetical protein
MTPRKLLTLYLIFSVYTGFAQGVKGKVTDEKNIPVGFVTIYCKEQKKGTNSNADGTFELHLPAGDHIVSFQSVGYKTKSISVSITSGSAPLTIKLEEQSYQLNEVKVSTGVNPAVWIMRKAIAAAPYYRRQILMYDARIYSKGSGTLEDIPFLFEKLLKKEGIEEGKTFLLESINEVSFTQPNTYKEKALSVKSSLPSEGAPEPMRMIRGSMYNTSDPDIISPLSPQAFSVYTFKLEGSFYEDKREVNRIKVTPKRKGQDVFEGYIYIMEGLWCLHSTDLKNVGNGFETKIVTSFRPINGYDFVWMPVTYDIKVKGGYLGFKGSFRYLCSVSNYKIKLNPNLDHNWVKKQTKEIPALPAVKEDVAEKPKPEAPKTKRQQDIEKLLAKEELSKMEMLKLANKMKMESEAEQRKTLEIVKDSSSMTVDSLATKRDSSFWLENRPVALMESEVVSYKQFDSVSTKKQKDSTEKVKRDSSGFDWFAILFGDSSNFNKGKNRFVWSGIGPGGEVFVNTVDGWGASVLWKVGSNRKDGKEWLFTNRIRVPFERQAVNTFGNLSYWYRPEALGKISIEGGTYVSDFNPTGGPTIFINSLMLLFDQRNLAKLYQQDYVKLTHEVELTNGLLWQVSGGWYNRYALSNISRFASKETIDGKITPNTPVPAYSFPTHQATVLTNSFTFTPRQRYRIENGRKQYVQGRFPTIGLTTTNGVGVLSSDVDYMKTEVSISERIRPLHWLFINARLGHQFFVYNNASYFPDYNQVHGNRSPLLTGNPIATFRQLDYYKYANTSSITSLNAEFDFKRLIIKRLPLINMTNLREVIFFNGLYMPSLKPYQEIGYSIDGIIGFMRVDVFAGFKQTTYNNWGVRLVVNLKGIE